MLKSVKELEEDRNKKYQEQLVRETEEKRRQKEEEECWLKNILQNEVAIHINQIAKKIDDIHSNTEYPYKQKSIYHTIQYEQRYKEEAVANKVFTLIKENGYRVNSKRIHNSMRYSDDTAEVEYTHILLEIEW